MICRCFGYTGLTVLMLLFFLLACITSVVLTNRSYNSVAKSHWVLVGALTETGATFRIRMPEDENATYRLVVATEPLESIDSFEVGGNETSVVWNELIQSENNAANKMNNSSPIFVSSVVIDTLQPETAYHYGTIDGNSDRIVQQGEFRTAPPLNQRTNFQFAAAGCAMSASQHAVFSEIAKEDILLFFHLGDFHYYDINSDDLGERMRAIDKVMGSSSQGQLYAKTALAMMWDDHDWLGNDSFGNSPGRTAALESYRQAFPFPEPLPSDNSTNGSDGVYHAFTIGTVRFILSDLRSERSEGVMYSEEQRDWLFDELSQAALYDFVVWITPSPWIGDVDPEEDNWMGAESDRSELSTFISEQLASIQNLLAVSADAHMVGFDDGTHTFYGDVSATGTKHSFPILHTGPLDRLGSIKGGPYSDGCTAYKYERNHQYSVIGFDGSGEEPCLDITSFRVFEEHHKEIIFTKRLCGEIFRSSEEAPVAEGACEAELFSTTNVALIATASSMLVVIFLESCFLGEGIFGAFLVSAIVLCMFGLSLVAGLYIPIAQDYDQFDTFPIALIGFLEIWAAVVYLICWICASKRR